MDEALTVINDPFAKNTLPLYQLPKAKIKPPQYILSPDRYITKVRGNIFSKLDANTKSQVLPKNRLEYTLQELDISFNTQFSKTQFPRKLGKELFVVKNGQPVPKNYHGGTNPVYNGNGICNYINCANLSAPLPTIIINRVGDHCGRVHIADTTCYIADNAMYISEFKADFDIIFLFFLFRNLNLNGLKGGTGAPSIRQDAIYDTEFMLPPLQEQQAFSDSIREEMRYVNEMIVEQAQIYRQEVLF